MIGPDLHSPVSDSAIQPTVDQVAAPSRRALVPRTWRPGAALALAVSVLGINLVASIVARRVLGLGLADAFAALLVAVCFIGAYLVPLGAVWLVSASSGVGFAQAVALRRPRDHSTAEWVAPALLGAVTARAFALAFGVVVTLLRLRLPGMNANPFSLFPGGFWADVALVVITVFLAPFAEEVVFRGVLLSALDARWGTVAAVIGSASVFSLVHVNAFLFLPILVASLIFGTLFVRFESLWPAYLCHAAFNGVAVFLAIALRGSGLL